MTIDDTIISLIARPEARHESLRNATIFLEVQISDNTKYKDLKTAYRLSAVYPDETRESKYRCEAVDLATQAEVERALCVGFAAASPRRAGKEGEQ